MDDPKCFDPKLFDPNTNLTDIFRNKRERKESVRRGKMMTNSKTPSTTGTTSILLLLYITIKDLLKEMLVIQTCSIIRIIICHHPILMIRFLLLKRLLVNLNAKVLVSLW